jgi:hypothetical protein
MYRERDPVLEEVVARAFRRFDANLSAALPRSASKLRGCLRRVPTCPEHLFYPRNFPLVLPYWLSPSDERVADVGFQTDVIYSSISGYYSIRLCDDIADNDGSAELRKLAPCALYFDNEAIRPYMNHFPAAHGFWNLLDTFLAQQAEASAADSLLDDVDEEAHLSLSSRKFTGTKIPVSAVGFRYSSPESAVEAWLRFVDCLGGFAQFHSDFFDWHHDAKHGITTYVSSEARRRAPGEGIASWFLREGFDWGAAELKLRFDNVMLHAQALGNQAILGWATARGRALEEDVIKSRSGIELLKRLGSVIAGK